MRGKNYILLFLIICPLLSSCTENVDTDKYKYYCEKDSECKSGYVCINNVCVRSRDVGDTNQQICRSDNDCLGEGRCIDGICQLIVAGDSGIDTFWIEDGYFETGMDGGEEILLEDTSIDGIGDVPIYEVGVDEIDGGCRNECYTIGKIECEADYSYRECIKSEDGCLIWSNKRVCNAPPENYCVDINNIRIYEQSGRCVNNGCEYQYREQKCPSGCANGKCQNCVPNCNGKECGDDGCGGSCGNCNNVPSDYCMDSTTLRDYTGFSNCTNYKCIYPYTDTKCPFGCLFNSCRSCPSTWRKDISGIWLEGMAIDTDGSIFAVGRSSSDLGLKDGDKVVVLKMDPCGDSLIRNDITNNVRAGASSVVIDTTYAYIAGSQCPSINAGDICDTYAARINKNNLSVVNLWNISGTSSRIDFIKKVIPFPNDILWGVGTANDSSKEPYTIPNIMMMKMNTNSGQYCNWNPFPPDGDTYDYGTDIAYNSIEGRVYFTGRMNTTEGYLSSFLISDCSYSQPCSCSPTGNTVKIIYNDPNIYATHPYSMLLDSNNFFITGLLTDQGGLWEGFVAKVSGNSVLLSDKFKMTQKYDAFAHIGNGPSDNLVIVSGLIGYDGSSSVGSATGIVSVYDKVNLKQVATFFPSNTNICFSSGIDAGGGIVLVCDTPTGASIIRCTSSGICP